VPTNRSFKYYLPGRGETWEGSELGEQCDGVRDVEGNGGSVINKTYQRCCTGERSHLFCKERRATSSLKTLSDLGAAQRRRSGFEISNRH
jgi:hypothetical protein